MEKFEYNTMGVCSEKITFEFDGDIITNIIINKGCSGNGKGIAELCKGRSIDEVIDRLSGIPCGPRGTSCPDQIAKALIEYKK